MLNDLVEFYGRNCNRKNEHFNILADYIKYKYKHLLKQDFWSYRRLQSFSKKRSFAKLSKKNQSASFKSNKSNN